MRAIRKTPAAAHNVQVGYLLNLSLETRRALGKFVRCAQRASSEVLVIEARTALVISQSRELMARVDDLLTLPYLK